MGEPKISLDSLRSGYPCRVTDLGLVDYDTAYRLQKKAVLEVQAGGRQEIFLCEHPPVITLGRKASPSSILVPSRVLEKAGIKVLSIDRGGEVTLHAPGQLVVYPILDLNFYNRDLKKYLHKLEQVAIDLLKGFDIVADRFLGRTGVWFGSKKIASLGVGVKRWVSFHGLGLNVHTDLSLFGLIRPCGMDVPMTTMAAIRLKPPDMRDVKKEIVQQFERHFRLRLEPHVSATPN